MLRRALVAGIFAAPAMVGCSLLVSLDGLSSSDAGISDAAIAIDSASDAAPIDATPEAETPYLVVDPCAYDKTDVVNLTALGTLDWSHFTGPAGESDVKNISTHLIGQLTQSAAGNQTYTDDSRTFAWTDGTTTPSEPGTHSGVYDNFGPMILSVPASSSRRVLTVYVGTFTSNGQLDVALSAGLVAPPQSFPGIAGSGYEYRCAIHYSAPTAAILTVQWSLTAIVDGGGSVANIAFPAATLASE